MHFMEIILGLFSSKPWLSLDSYHQQAAQHRLQTESQYPDEVRAVCKNIREPKNGRRDEGGDGWPQLTLLLLLLLLLYKRSINSGWFILPG